jgi:hypothetical protein
MHIHNNRAHTENTQPRTFTATPTRTELQSSPLIISRRPGAGGVVLIVRFVLVQDRRSCQLGAGGVALWCFLFS